MRTLISITFLALILCGNVFAKSSDRQSNKFETRCGWFSNPTPSNIVLYDADGEWIISAQGSYQAEGDWEWPKFKKGQWVNTNLNYGYGCACFKMKVDEDTSKVIEIKKSRAKPLKACRKDKALIKWGDLFE